MEEGIWSQSVVICFCSHCLEWLGGWLNLSVRLSVCRSSDEHNKNRESRSGSDFLPFFLIPHLTLPVLHVSSSFSSLFRQASAGEEGLVEEGKMEGGSEMWVLARKDCQMGGNSRSIVFLYTVNSAGGGSLRM